MAVGVEVFERRHGRGEDGAMPGPDVGGEDGGEGVDGMEVQVAAYVVVLERGC